MLQATPATSGAAWMVLDLVAYAAYRQPARPVAPRSDAGGGRRAPSGRAARVDPQTLPDSVDTGRSNYRRPTCRHGRAARGRAPDIVVLLALPRSARRGDGPGDRRPRGVSTGSPPPAATVGERTASDALTSHLRTRDPAESILAEANRRESQVILFGPPASSARSPPGGLRPRRPPDRGRGRQRVMIVRPEVADVKHHTLIVCTDSRIEPELLANALADALAAHPATRSRWSGRPPGVLRRRCRSAPGRRGADRLNRLREAADGPPRRCAAVPGRVRAVPQCLGLPRSSWPVDALVLVGSAGWGVRRAARGVAPEWSSSPPGARPRRRWPRPVPRRSRSRRWPRMRA